MKYLSYRLKYIGSLFLDNVWWKVTPVICITTAEGTSATFVSHLSLEPHTIVPGHCIVIHITELWSLLKTIGSPRCLQFFRENNYKSLWDFRRKIYPWDGICFVALLCMHSNFLFISGQVWWPELNSSVLSVRSNEDVARSRVCISIYTSYS